MAKVSVLIVSYNYGRFLRPCIESVLAQTCSEELEIVLVDDGSTDETAEVLRGFPMVRAVFQPHAGVAAARNRAFREATGDYLAFLDADDLWKKEKLALQLQYLREHPDCEIVFTGYENFLENGVSPDEKWVRQSILFARKNRTCLPTALFTRSLMQRCGEFDESFPRGEDTEWTSRLGFLGVQSGFLEEKLLLRRLHGQNLTKAAADGPSEESAAKAFEIIRRNLQLRKERISPEEGISVLIPAYQAEATIRECIESIKKQLPLLQGLPLEILVADDGSEDSTASVAAKSGARVLSLPHRGPAAARNTALRQAAYVYIFFLDADDRAAGTALPDLLQALRKENSPMAVFARARDFTSGTDGNGNLQERFSSRSYAGCLPGCSLIRKEAFQKVGPFNEDLKTGETVEWMNRFRESGLPCSELDCVTLERRIHPASTGSVNREQEQRDYARIIREHLKRMNRE
jgi:glycosyltransferase involved in cell wall biosynthesis